MGAVHCWDGVIKRNKSKFGAGAVRRNEKMAYWEPVLFQDV